MALGDIYSVVVRGTLQGQTILNTLHYRESVTAGTGGQAALATIADSTLGQAWRNGLSQDFTYNDVTVQHIWPLPVTYPTVNGTDTGVGAVASASSPSEVAAVITKRTAFAGPFYRGRAFISGIALSGITGASLNATGITQLTNHVTAMGTVLTSGGYSFTPIIWHRHVNTYSDQAGLVLRLTLRAQRRRQPGRGQ